ncbi:hypothetical protein C8R43DRAFT_1156259 [Mycena crocata]|nr:hypothetical protein C8R43DRAFT_1156259 [Mycena crocata]
MAHLIPVTPPEFRLYCAIHVRSASRCCYKAPHADARFNHFLVFDAPPAASWPVLVFFNGLGGHRLIAAMIEGIAREHHVQILTLDKPGGGGSSSAISSARGTTIASRTRWMHTAVLAVLAYHHTTSFAALSHSNGPSSPRASAAPSPSASPLRSRPH